MNVSANGFKEFIKKSVVFSTLILSQTLVGVSAVLGDGGENLLLLKFSRVEDEWSSTLGTSRLKYCV